MITRSAFWLVPALALFPTLASAQLVNVVPTMYESAFEDSGKDYYAPQSCDASCCDVIQECCCGPCTSWSASVDYVHMWRKGPDAVTILYPTPTGLTANEFDFHGQSGIDTTLAYDNGCGHGAEIRYFWLDEFSADRTLGLASTFNFLLPATNPITGLVVLTTVPTDVRYQSSIQSIEVSGRGASEYFNFTYGFRYLNLTETLSIKVQNDPVYDFRTQNDLYGFQLGIDGNLFDASRFSIGYFSKAGIYYNDASVNSQVAGGSIAAGGASDGVAAFVAETGLSGRYDICRNLSLTAGYRFLFLDGVSLAADQVPNTGDMSLNPIAMNIDSNSLYYHGFNVGFELRR